MFQEPGRASEHAIDLYEDANRFFTACRADDRTKMQASLGNLLEVALEPHVLQRTPSEETRVLFSNLDWRDGGHPDRALERLQSAGRHIVPRIIAAPDILLDKDEKVTIIRVYARTLFRAYESSTTDSTLNSMVGCCRELGEWTKPTLKSAISDNFLDTESRVQSTIKALRKTRAISLFHAGYYQSQAQRKMTS